MNRINAFKLCTCLLNQVFIDVASEMIPTVPSAYKSSLTNYS